GTDACAVTDNAALNRRTGAFHRHAVIVPVPLPFKRLTAPGGRNIGGEPFLCSLGPRPRTDPDIVAIEGNKEGGQILV
ncbi:MAG: hypothetical protein PHG30_10500, partial [Eubacteriales bacterium]|nr:hypothetical protein [Eubacteriales bacterium]